MASWFATQVISSLVDRPFAGIIMQCFRCQAQNPDHKKQCERCGAPLNLDALPSSGGGARLPRIEKLPIPAPVPSYENPAERQKIARMSDDELAKFQKEYPLFDALFQPGRYAPGFGSNIFGIFLEHPRGEARIIPNFPREVRYTARVIVEEHLFRALERIANGILADMLLFTDRYRALWNSFGEAEVWEEQYETYCQRMLYRQGITDDKADPSSLIEQSLEAFQRDLVGQLTQGMLTPLSGEQIASMGICCVGRTFACNDRVSINDLLTRFHSPLRFLTHSSLPDSSHPFQFILASGQEEPYIMHDDVTGEQLHAVMFGADQVLVHSPALAPDMSGWTPNYWSPH